ncbi:MAG: hypothetical protein ACKVG0_04595 [Alphaproteobacteria bacterium]|jgi:hypothetical protein
MAHGDGGEGFPKNAMIASYLLDVLRQRGVLRRTGLAETILNISDNVPQHLIGEQRIASLSALRSLLDNPNENRVTLRDWFKF